jgi:hypothetical protein
MPQQNQITLPQSTTTLLSFPLLPRAHEVGGAVVLRYIPNTPTPYATHIRIDRDPLNPVFSDGGYFTDLAQAHTDWISRVRFETRKHLQDLLPPTGPAPTPPAPTKTDQVAAILTALYEDRALSVTFAELVEGVAALAGRIGAGTIDQAVATSWRAARVNLSNLVESGGLFDVSSLQ